MKSKRQRPILRIRGCTSYSPGESLYQFGCHSAVFLSIFQRITRKEQERRMETSCARRWRATPASAGSYCTAQRETGGDKAKKANEIACIHIFSYSIYHSKYQEKPMTGRGKDTPLPAAQHCYSRPTPSHPTPRA